MRITLREVRDGDLPLFFAFMSDPEATRMAAFTSEDPTDRAAFNAHWARIRASDAVLMRTVLADGEVVGNVGVYGSPAEREVTYWIDRAHWGRGLATAALRALLDAVRERPLHARAAAD
ncbi:MAG TPA: GNAT family N-acetyltransferase, partial [Streptomyces sp.]